MFPNLFTQLYCSAFTSLLNLHWQLLFFHTDKEYFWSLIELFWLQSLNLFILLVYFRGKINLQKNKLKSVLINEIQFCVRLLKCYIHQGQFLYFKISVKIWTINNALGQEQVCSCIIMLSCVLNFHLLLPIIHSHW